MSGSLNRELAVVLAGELAEFIVLDSELSLKDGKRDGLGEIMALVDCWSRVVIAVAEALRTRGIAEGEARSPEDGPFAVSEKMARIALETLDGRSFTVTAVGFDGFEEGLVVSRVMFVPFETDISAMISDDQFVCRAIRIELEDTIQGPRNLRCWSQAGQRLRG